MLKEEYLDLFPSFWEKVDRLGLKPLDLLQEFSFKNNNVERRVLESFSSNIVGED